LGKPASEAISEEDWNVVPRFVAHTYRLAYASDDPKKKVAELDAKYRAQSFGQRAESARFHRIVAAAKDQAKRESPAERQYQIDLFNAQKKVSDALTALDSTPEKMKHLALLTLNEAGAALMKLELRHELAQLPAGPGGSHTPDQWIAAAAKVAQRHRISGEAAEAIKRMARIEGYLDQIQKNPRGLTADEQELAQRDPATLARLKAAGISIDRSNAIIRGYMKQIQANSPDLPLTEAEKELAQKDPVTLAFLKAAGVTLHTADPKRQPDMAQLQDQMQQIAQQEPVLFANLKRSGVEIQMNTTPVKGDSTLGQLPGGQFLHVTVHGKDVNEQALNYFVQIYSLTSDNPAVAVGWALLPGLQLEADASLQGLMVAADNERLRYAQDRMKTLMGAGSPDIKTALSFFSTQSSKFFLDSTAEAFWNSSGEPNFGHEFFRREFERLLQDTREQPKPGNTRDYTGVKADKIGRRIQEILKVAPDRHIARAMLDTVKDMFDDKWEVPNLLATRGQYFKHFFEGLSAAVELNPERADEFAGWFADPKSPQSKILSPFWESAAFTGFQAAYESASIGNGTLSGAIGRAIDKDPHLALYQPDLNSALERAQTEIQEAYENKINKQAYNDFMKDPDKALTPFFRSFLNDTNISHPAAFADNTKWHDIIGKTLGLTPDTPGGQEAAAKNDYSVEWYRQDTPQGNAIKLVMDWLRARGAAEPGAKVTPLPFKYAARRAGVKTAGLFLIAKPGTPGYDDPSKQEVIDGGAAREAVWMNGGKPVDANNVNIRWHYDDFAHFQTGNNYEPDGFIYLPGSPRIIGYNNDGKLMPGGYQQFHAHIKAPGERVQEIGRPILAGIGVIAMFTGQEYAVPLFLIAGGGNAAFGSYNLSQMRRYGASIGWSNPDAAQEWFNVGGFALSTLRLGLLAGAGARAGILPTGARYLASFSGLGATYIGMKQTFAGVSSAYQTLTDPDATLGEMIWSAANIGLGLTTITASGVRVGRAPPAAEGEPPPKPTMWQQFKNNFTTDIEGQNTTRWRAYLASGKTWGVRLGAVYGVSQLGVGVPGWAISNLGRNDRRIGAPVTPDNADAELGQCLANPEQYMKDHYEPTLFGAGASWAGYEADCHLRAFNGRGHPEYYRRITDPLYQELLRKAQGGAKAAPPPAAPPALPAQRPAPAPAPAQKPGQGAAQPKPAPGKVPSPEPGAQPLRRRRRRRRGRVAPPARHAPSRRSAPRSTRPSTRSGRGRRRRWQRRGDAAGQMTASAPAAPQVFPAAALNLPAAFAFPVAAAAAPAASRVAAAAAPASSTVAAAAAPASAAPVAAKPWLLTPPSARRPQPFIEDGKLYIHEWMELSKSGEYSRTVPDVNLSQPDPKLLGQLPDDVKQAIGVYGFMSWQKGGKQQGMEAAPLWGTALLNFQGQTGAGAYNAWVKAGRPAGGDNVYWTQAVAEFKSKILARGPTPAQRRRAEQHYGPEIAVRAYELWLLDGRKPGTAGAAEWQKGEPALQEQIGKPAFDAWVAKGAKTGSANDAWQKAVGEWEKDGKPIVAMVELRRPYRFETDRDRVITSEAKDGPASSRNRMAAGLGPLEGWRIYFYDEVTKNYRYNIEDATTFRWGMPSPTQPSPLPWVSNVDVRQQDTTIDSRFMFGFGAMAWNGGADGLQTYDLTEGTQRGGTVMNVRVYWDLGNRNRSRVEIYNPSKGMWEYVRIPRETLFSETGFGFDFAKLIVNPDWTYNFNFYFEGQFYPADFRSRVERNDWRFVANQRSFTATPFSLGVDPAFQFTITSKKLKGIFLPWLQAPVR
jgi:hypothetical protein